MPTNRPDSFLPGSGSLPRSASFVAHWGNGKQQGHGVEIGNRINGTFWSKWQNRSKKSPKNLKIPKIAKNCPKLPKIAVFDLRLVPNGHGHHLRPIVTKKESDLLFESRKRPFLSILGRMRRLLRHGQNRSKIDQNDVKIDFF